MSRKRSIRSNLYRFTEFCNSQCLSHFAAPFIVVRAETSVAESCIEALADASQKLQQDDTTRFRWTPRARRWQHLHTGGMQALHSGRTCTPEACKHCTARSAPGRAGDGSSRSLPPPHCPAENCKRHTTLKQRFHISKFT